MRHGSRRSGATGPARALNPELERVDGKTVASFEAPASRPLGPNHVETSQRGPGHLAGAVGPPVGTTEHRGQDPCRRACHLSTDDRHQRVPAALRRCRHLHAGGVDVRESRRGISPRAEGGPVVRDHVRLGPQRGRLRPAAECLVVRRLLVSPTISPSRIRCRSAGDSARRRTSPAPAPGTAPAMGTSGSAVGGRPARTPATSSASPLSTEAIAARSAATSTVRPSFIAAVRSRRRLLRSLSAGVPSTTRSMVPRPVFAALRLRPVLLPPSLPATHRPAGFPWTHRR